MQVFFTLMVCKYLFVNAILLLIYRKSRVNFLCKYFYFQQWFWIRDRTSYLYEVMDQFSMQIENTWKSLALVLGPGFLRWTYLEALYFAGMRCPSRLLLPSPCRYAASRRASRVPGVVGRAAVGERARPLNSRSCASVRWYLFTNTLLVRVVKKKNVFNRK